MTNPILVAACLTCMVCLSCSKTYTMRSEDQSIASVAPYEGSTQDWMTFYEKHKGSLYASDMKSILLKFLKDIDSAEEASKALQSIGFDTAIYYEPDRAVAFAKLSFGLALGAKASGFRHRDIRGHFRLRSNGDIDKNSLIIKDTYVGL